MLPEQQTSLIQAAIAAPSADNSQPFLFHWRDENTLELWIDEKRAGKASDNRFVLSDIALGAVIENVCIQAQAINLSTKVHYLPEEEQPLYVAIINFTEEENSSNDDKTLVSYIPERCTDRRFPFKGPVDESTIVSMSEAAKINQCNVQWYKDKAAIKSVLPVIQQAESIRFKSQILHQELFSTVKFSDPTSEEGMPIDVLAIEAPAKPFFKLMKNWSVMNFFNKLGAASMLGFRSVKIPILFSPTLALITIKDNSRESVIKGGRAIQRVWLTATKHSLSVQPYAAPGIFSLGFTACEAQFNESLNDVAKQMNSNVYNNAYGLMFMRIGKNSPVQNKTNRRPIETFQK